MRKIRSSTTEIFESATLISSKLNNPSDSWFFKSLYYFTSNNKLNVRKKKILFLVFVNCIHFFDFLCLFTIQSNIYHTCFSILHIINFFFPEKYIFHNTISELHSKSSTSVLFSKTIIISTFQNITLIIFSYRKYFSAKTFYPKSYCSTRLIIKAFIFRSLYQSFAGKNYIWCQDFYWWQQFIFYHQLCFCFSTKYEFLKYAGLRISLEYVI